MNSKTNNFPQPNNFKPANYLDQNPKNFDGQNQNFNQNLENPNFGIPNSQQNLEIPYFKILCCIPCCFCGDHQASKSFKFLSSYHLTEGIISLIFCLLSFRLVFIQTHDENMNTSYKVNPNGLLTFSNFLLTLICSITGFYLLNKRNKGCGLATAGIIIFIMNILRFISCVIFSVVGLLLFSAGKNSDSEGESASLNGFFAFLGLLLFVFGLVFSLLYGCMVWMGCYYSKVLNAYRREA